LDQIETGYMFEAEISNMGHRVTVS